MTKSQLKKSILKFRQYYEAKRKEEPARRRKNLLRLINFEDERCNKAWRLGKIVHKQNATNANLTCTTASEEVKVRKQPDEVNK